jgi:hypothetical protein
MPLRSVDSPDLQVYAIYYFPLASNICPCLDNYIIGYPDDKWRTKLIVFGVYFVECVQTALALYNVFTVIRLDELDFEIHRRCQIIAMSEVVCSVIGQDPRSFSAFDIQSDY